MGPGGRLGVAAMATIFTAGAGAHMVAPPADRPDINTFNVEGEEAGAAPNVGLICVWAINASMLEVGRRCGVTANPALLGELERSVSRMEDYARRQSPARAADMAAYREREITGDTQLCSSDIVAGYNSVTEQDIARIRQDTDALLARSPAVEWGDTCV